MKKTLVCIAGGLMLGVSSETLDVGFLCAAFLFSIGFVHALILRSIK